VVYEEHILQICEAFAGLPPGRADVLRRALNKQKRAVIEEIQGEFFAIRSARGHSPEKTAEVWGLVTGFAGYAFCKAHSTAYGVEAYQSAWLKRYFPAEFMAAVLTNGKGFYHPLVYVLECHRLGLKLLPPSVNEPGPAFVPHGRAHRVPLTRMKGLTNRTTDAILDARAQGPFASLADFFHRVTPSGEELESMIRAGAFDEFGENERGSFGRRNIVAHVWLSVEPKQGWLIPPPIRPIAASPWSSRRAGTAPCGNGTVWLCRQRPSARTFRERRLGHVLSGEPSWRIRRPDRLTLRPRRRAAHHHQITGEPMKFLTLADWTGIVETELFAQTYKTYGLATVRYPVLEIEAHLEPFENGRGFSLRALAARNPRLRSDASQ
jgi:DNA polymerase III alpha subunit